jgi:putative MATE family efflux protein
MEKKKSKKIIHDYTTGNLPKQMLLFSLPFMLSNCLQVFYGIVDMIVVGHFVGSDGLSAVSTASQVFNFFTMLALGFAMGGQVVIAQLVGAKKTDDLQKCIGTLFTLVMGLGVVMTVGGLFLCNPVLKLMQTPPEAFAMASDYLYICTAGMIFSFGYNLVASILRGEGESVQPCIYIAVAAATNLVFDLIFVGIFNWGVAGAAAATVLGQAVSFIWSIIYLVRHKEAFGFDFKPASFRPDKRLTKNIVSLGVPFALRSAAVHISMLFVTSLVNSVGVAASAVYGVGLKVDDVVRKITMGFNYAASAMVGQNIAAGDIKRTRRVVYWSWIYSVAVYFVFFIVYITNIELLFRLFTDDAEVLSLAPVFVKAIVWSFPAMAIMRGTNGFISGIGNSSLGLAFSLLDGLVLRIGLSWLLGTVLNMGLYGYFLGYGLATYGTALPGAIYFLFGRWKNRKLRI